MPPVLGHEEDCCKLSSVTKPCDVEASLQLKQTIAQRRDAGMPQVEKFQDSSEIYVYSEEVRLPGVESDGNTVPPLAPNAASPAFSENEQGAGPKRSLVINKKFQPHKKGGLQTIVVNKLGGDSMLFDLPSRTTVLHLREIIAAQQKCASSRVHLFGDHGVLMGNQHAPPEVSMMLYSGGEWQGEHEGVDYELSVAGNHFCFSCSNHEMSLEGRVDLITVDDVDLEIMKDRRFVRNTSLLGKRMLFSRQADGGLRGMVPVSRGCFSGVCEWKVVMLEAVSV